MGDLSQELEWEDEQELDPTEEYQTLLRSLRRTAGFGLFFVECSPAEGGRIMARVREDLSQRVGELQLQDSAEDSNVFKRVKQMLEAEPAQVLFISGLEQLLYGYEETKRRLDWSTAEIQSYSWKDAPLVMVHLNQQREKFRDSFEARLVFLLPRFALKYVIARSPDFFDWRSGVFRFPIGNVERLRQSLSRVISDALNYESLTLEDRKKKLLEIETLLGEDTLSNDDRASLLSYQGLIFYFNKQHEEALSVCTSALAIKPDLEGALNTKGNVLSELDRYEEAIAVYDAALAIKSDLHETLNNKGNALGQLGRYAEEIAAYDAALVIKPDYYEALYNKGYALDELGRYEEAIGAYDAALCIEPNYHQALNNKGYTLDELGRYEEAIDAYDAALAIKPDKYEALYNKACCYALWNKCDLALQQLEQAIALNPKYREQAKTDEDLAYLWEDARFKAITDQDATTETT